MIVRCGRRVVPFGRRFRLAREDEERRGAAAMLARPSLAAGSLRDS